MRHALTLLLYLVLNAVTLANTWITDYQKSAVTFTGTHAGITFNGAFNKYATIIYFDPNNLQKTVAKITFDLTKTYVDNNYYQQTLQSEDWFDTTNYPSAEFNSTKVEKRNDIPNAYTIYGILTLKGIKKPLVIDATIDIEEESASLKANFSIPRDVFNIGSSSDPEGVWVSNTIDVKVVLLANRTR